MAVDDVAEQVQPPGPVDRRAVVADHLGAAIQSYTSLETTVLGQTTMNTGGVSPWEARFFSQCSNERR